MPKKCKEENLTFYDISVDFRRRHPRLNEQVVFWLPYDYMQIAVLLNNSKIIVYDYRDHKGLYMSEDDRNYNDIISVWKRRHASN